MAVPYLTERKWLVMTAQRAFFERMSEVAKTVGSRARMDLARGREGLCGLLHHQKPVLSGLAKAERFIHHVPREH